ncbi:MAG: sugar ABC transporter permease [Clostridiales bacterium]|nr:sugar ABC transporter permease [Clostridiales bacterium]
MKSKWFVRAVLLPAVILFATFMVFPIVSGLVIAMFDYNPLRSENSFIGLSNFIKLFHDATFIKSLKNTLTFVFVTVALNITVCLFLSTLISSLRWGRLRSLFRVLFFMPCVAPLVASSTVWRGLYSPKYGLINNFMESVLHIPAINWLGTPAFVMPAIILFTLWADMGYNIILFSAGMDGIPSDFYEAAEMDGTNAIKKFFFITLPLLGRTMSFVVAMTLISHFQMFAQFQVLAGRTGGPNQAGNVLTYYIYKTAFQAKDMGYASAIAIALFVIIMIVTLIQQRASRVDWGY